VSEGEEDRGRKSPDYRAFAIEGRALLKNPTEKGVKERGVLYQRQETEGK